MRSRPLYITSFCGKRSESAESHDRVHGDPAQLLCNSQDDEKKGFTLIELSIVLVIIGLIVGGVLVGQSLINAASIRAQITQIEKFQTAARTFQGKYGYLPGDIPNPYATQFGFIARGSGVGQGDGNGVLTNGCCSQSYAELSMFWVDLSTAGLIDGGFNTALPNTPPGADVPLTGVGSYLPSAKIGGGNYIYVWAAGMYNGTAWVYTGTNYYGISAVTAINAVSNYGAIPSTKALTVAQAYAMDQKVDDGLPEYGNVLAIYVNGQTQTWSDGTAGNSQTPIDSPDTNSITAGATTCYDNAGASANVKHYSVTYNGGTGVNCGLSFKFQ